MDLKLLIEIAAAALVLWGVSCLAMMLLAHRLPPGLLKDIAEFLPACVTTARRLRKHPAVRRRARVALLVAIVWVLSPIDLLPEFLPIIGPLDDVVAVILLLRYAARAIPAEVLFEAWPAEPRLLERLLGRDAPTSSSAIATRLVSFEDARRATCASVTSMDIGIIGAGKIGGTLTRRLAALGHNVRVANSRAPETLSDLAAETGATAVWAGEAAEGADLVIVSIPQKNVVDLAPGIVDARRDGAPVIETNNYYPRERDGLIAAIEDGQPESAWVAEQIGAPVYKVFNGIFWRHLLERGAPAGADGRIALPIAGDDPAGKHVVFRLIDELGFDPVDGGTLAESWRQQPGTPVYGADLDAEGAVRALAEASPERPEAFRAER